MRRRPAAECCERSERCIEAPAGRFDTILLRKITQRPPNRCLSAVPKAQCIEGTAICSGRFDTIFAAQKSLSDLRCARDGSGMSRRRCRWFSARRRRPAEAPRTGGRGRAARAPAQNHGIRQGEYERTARRRRVRKRVSARALRRPEAEPVAPPRRAEARRADGRT